MTLGEHLIILRNSRGLSQSDLAEAINVSRQSVSKWELGTSTPDLDKLVKLADFFSLTLDELVKGEKTENPPPSAPVKEPTETAKIVLKRTKIQSMGLFFLCLSAFASLLLAILFGFYGIFFAVPLFLFGLICYFKKKHPLLTAFWCDYLLFSVFLHSSTALNPTHILRIFQWNEHLNYRILFWSSVWFFAVLSLIVGTAVTFRKKEFSSIKKETGMLFSGVLLFFSSYLTVMLPPSLPFYLLYSYLQLAGLTVLSVVFARGTMRLRQKRKNQEN